jgi:hypothetical protein
LYVIEIVGILYVIEIVGILYVIEIVGILYVIEIVGILYCPVFVINTNVLSTGELKNYDIQYVGVCGEQNRVEQSRTG